MMTYRYLQFSPPLMTRAIFEMKMPKEKVDESVDLFFRRNVIKINGKNQAIVELTAQLNKKGDVERENVRFIAEVAMQSTFTWAESINEAQSDELLEKDASELLLSYIRPVIAMLTNVAPIPTCHIPYVDMGAISRDALQQHDRTSSLVNK